MRAQAGELANVAGEENKEKIAAEHLKSKLWFFF